MYAERHFSPSPEAPRLVRAWVRRLLHAAHLPTLEHAASVVVTELVTNAVLHARTDMTVRLETRGHLVRISVADEHQEPPVIRDYGTDATTGRGLRLVAKLGAQWGVEPRPTGKAVWCELVPAADDDDTTADSDGQSQRVG